MNRRLRDLFEQDQADRRGRTPQDLGARDRRRRLEVEALLAGGAAVAAEDHYHAAMVLQHGSS